MLRKKHFPAGIPQEQVRGPVLRKNTFLRKSPTSKNGDPSPENKCGD